MQSPENKVFIFFFYFIVLVKAIQLLSNAPDNNICVTD